MKHFLASAGLITVLAVCSSNVLARDKHQDHNKHRYEDNARVTHVEPLYSTIRVSTPYQECDNKHSKKNYSRNNNYTSTIAGSVIGGVIANQFGKGNGKTAITVAGTLLGGAIGHTLNYQSRTAPYYKSRANCHVTNKHHKEQRLDGYRVSYRYHGRTYTTNMDHRPGRYIPIAISVRPIGRYY